MIFLIVHLDYQNGKKFISMEKPEPYHYNYQALDKFLRTDSDPKELGDQLDQLMADLVNVSRNEDDYGKALSDHHFTLRRLRNIFWCLQVQAGQQLNA